MPVPELPPVIVIKVELFITVQAQPAPVTTFTLPDPAAELTLELFVLSEYEQLAPPVSVMKKCCETLSSVSVISADVLLTTAVVFTVKVALDRPAAILTEAGTVACVTLLKRSIVVVLAAALPRLMVQVDGSCGVTVDGLQLKVETKG